jgi:hypothetical protein
MEERQRQEARILRILEGSSNEDSYVDRKLTLPTSDAHKNARKIAGLCNSARGTEVLWIIGVGDDGALYGVGEIELARWWPQVRKHFEEVAPEMTDISVWHDGKRFHGLFFRSDRAPYVVRADSARADLLEVPWREGTATRSARRSELFRILSSTSSLPKVELSRFDLYIRNDGDVNNGTRVTGDGTREERWSVNLTGKVFVEHHEAFTIAIHRTSVRVRVPLAEFGEIGRDVRFWMTDDPAIEQTQHAIRVAYPTMLDIRSFSSIFLPAGYVPQLSLADDASFVLRLGVTQVDIPLTIEQSLTHHGEYLRHGPTSHPEYTWVFERP